MPALELINKRKSAVEKRLVTNDNGDLSIPRILGVIFVIVLLLVILFFGIRSARRRRARPTYNTRRNQGVVRVTRLEGYGSRPRSSGHGEELPPWSGNLNHTASPTTHHDGLHAPPPVYVKRQDNATLQRDPPPPYIGRDGPS
jgi:hypothetical protein